MSFRKADTSQGVTPHCLRRRPAVTPPRTAITSAAATTTPRPFDPRPTPKVLQRMTPTTRPPAPPLPARNASAPRLNVKPPSAAPARTPSNAPRVYARGGTIQRMNSPFDLPDIFAGFRAQIESGAFVQPPPLDPPPITNVPSSSSVPSSSVPTRRRLGPGYLDAPKKESPPPTPRKRSKPKFKPLVLGPRDDTTQFNALGASGEIDSHVVAFSQFTCGTNFASSFMLDGDTIVSVHDLAAKLKSKPTLYASTPPITITLYNNRIMSVDNRRLKAHKEAGVRIRYVKKAYDQLDGRELSHIDPSAPSDNLNVR